MARKWMWLPLAALAAWGAPGAVHAASFTVAPHASYRLDLDTVSGGVSVWDLKDLASLNALSATIQIHRLSQAPTSLPSFAIWLKSGANSVSFQIAGATQQPPLLMRMQRRVGATVVEDFIFPATLGLNQPLNLAIGWTPAGKVTMAFSAIQQRSMDLGSTPLKLEVTASAGEMELDPFKLGISGP